MVQRKECSKNDKLCAEAVWFTQKMHLGVHSEMDLVADAIRKVKAKATELKATV